MQTLQYYKNLKSQAERAQVKYHRAIVALQTETKVAARRVEAATRAWREKPSASTRRKMLLARKFWEARVKTLETLLGHIAP
jgi:hypothetical protein